MYNHKLPPFYYSARVAKQQREHCHEEDYEREQRKMEDLAAGNITEQEQQPNEKPTHNSIPCLLPSISGESGG